MIVVAIIFAVICLISSFKESKTTGLYKMFGVYGRVAAFFSIYCPLGLAFFIVSLFTDTPDSSLTYLIVAIFGAIFYVVAWIKCPAGALKKRLIPSMMISGFGVAMKIVVFYLKFVWDLFEPVDVYDEHGRSIVTVGDDVYDRNSGELINKPSVGGR